MDWSNKKDVLNAVRGSGWNLQFASEELLNDMDVILAALQNYAGAFEFIDDKYRKSKECVLAGISSDSCEGYAWADNELKRDKEVIQAAIRNTYSDEEREDLIAIALTDGVDKQSLLNAGVELELINKVEIYISNLDLD